MNKIEHGGDAFPCCGNPESDQMVHGMSLRDWFAGMALQGIIAHYGVTAVIGMHHVYQANEAYAQADAMLEQRGK